MMTRAMRKVLLKRFSLFAALLCAASLLYFAVPLESQSPSPEQRAKQRRERAMRWPVLRPVVRGTRGAVAAGTPLVTEAAMRTFHGGGNAVDAGIASLFAGAVSEFSHFGFGGEAPILIRTKDGKVYCIPGLGPAPQLMTREYFQSRRLQPENEQEARRRGKSTAPFPPTVSCRPWCQAWWTAGWSHSRPLAPSTFTKWLSLQLN